MLRLLVLAIALITTTQPAFAQSNDQLLNRALQVLEQLTRENQAMWERLNRLENGAGGAGGGQRLVVEGPWIIKQHVKSKRLGDFDMCALANADEHCQCAIELEGTRTWWLRKYEENYVECICGALCFSLAK